MKVKIYLPEILLGVYLTISVFAMGAIFYSSQITEHNKTDERSEQIRPPSPTDERIADYTLAIAILNGFLAAGVFFQVRDARKSNERQLRAYIHVRDVVVSLMNSEFDPNVQIIIKNYGQTPARRVTNTLFVDFISHPFDSSFDLKRGVVGQVTDLAPGQKVFSQTTISRSKFSSMKPSIESKKVRMYVFGRIEYFDVFGHARATEYRYRLPIDSDGVVDEISLVSDRHEGNRTT